MPPSRGKVRRKTYLNKGEVFNIPKSTRNWRKRHLGSSLQAPVSQQARNGSGTEPSFSGLEVPVPAAGRAELTATHDTPDTSSGTTVPMSNQAALQRESVSSGLREQGDDDVGSRGGQAERDGDDDFYELYEELLSDSENDREIDSAAPPSQEDIHLLSGHLGQFQRSALPNSTLTEADAIVMVMTFAVSHCLSWTALDDLIRLVNTLFSASGGILPRSKYLFRKLWAAKTTKLSKHFFYCKMCGSSLSFQDRPNSTECPTCGHSTSLHAAKRDGEFFTMLDFKSQVEHIVRLNANSLYANLSALKSEAERSEAPNAADITDITSAGHNMQLRQNGSLNWTDITVTFNSDGCPVFKSSKTAMWAIQIIVNELPPQDRFESTAVVGLWFGQGHPNMPLFLSRFVEEITESPVVTWSCGENTVTSTVYAICCCADAPARAAIQNHTLFSGYFGCPWCLTRGEHENGAMRYPDTEPDEERNHHLVIRDMQLALECGVSVNGVKGPSPVMNLKNFDVTWSFSVDYMHCVLLGVTRQLTDHWMSGSNSSELFYIGSPSTTMELDKRLTSIRPPHTFTRLPRSLKERNFWKASEWRHWLLFYSLPCTANLLPGRYWRHFSCLVESIFILASSRLTPTMIQKADALLRRFVAQMAALYGINMMTFNVHQLLHLSKSVSMQGPLWANSAFVFETGNGRLLKCVTAAKGAPLQVIERVVMTQELTALLSTVELSPPVRGICEAMLQPQRIKNATRVGSIWLLGCPKPAHLSHEEVALLEAATGVQHETVLEYTRFTLDGAVFHSEQYMRPVKGDTTVVYTDDNQFFKVRHILYMPGGNMVKCCLVCTDIIISSDGAPFPPHIQKCFLSAVHTTSVIAASRVVGTALFIQFPSEGNAYVCCMPNSVESD